MAQHGDDVHANGRRSFGTLAKADTASTGKHNGKVKPVSELACRRPRGGYRHTRRQGRSQFRIIPDALPAVLHQQCKKVTTNLTRPDPPSRFAMTFANAFRVVHVGQDVDLRASRTAGTPLPATS